MNRNIPWCECGVKRGGAIKKGGYTHIGNQIWVHSACMKPTKMFWERQVLVKQYKNKLDEIIERIIEKRELDQFDKGRADVACEFIAMIEGCDKVRVRNESVIRYKAKQSNNAMRDR